MSNKIITKMLAMCVLLTLPSCDQSNNIINDKTNTDNLSFQEIEPISKLDKQYLQFIDKNGNFTNLKEFNKNGRLLVFQNKNDKNETIINYIKNGFFLMETINNHKDINTRTIMCLDALYPIKTLDLDNFTYDFISYNELSDDDKLEYSSKLKNEMFLTGVDALMADCEIYVFNKEKREQFEKLIENTNYFEIKTQQEIYKIGYGYAE